VCDDSSHLPPSQHLGIDVRQRQAGEVILVETDNSIYELTVMVPRQCLVQVTGTDPRLRQPTVGRLLNSTAVLHPHDVRDAWIGPARRMLIAFRNVNFESGVIVSASIRGNGWHFDVF
jgi:hypothetical protein